MVYLRFMLERILSTFLLLFSSCNWNACLVRKTSALSDRCLSLMLSTWVPRHPDCRLIQRVMHPGFVIDRTGRRAIAQHRAACMLTNGKMESCYVHLLSSSSYKSEARGFHPNGLSRPVWTSLWICRPTLKTSEDFLSPHPTCNAPCSRSSRTVVACSM